jgi:FkbM family methyltransferase
MNHEFHWGWLNADNEYARGHKHNIEIEIFHRAVYEKLFSVRNGDVIVDLGASVGPFTYSILDKKPAKVYCLEPSDDSFPTLLKNVSWGPVTCIKSGISDIDGEKVLHAVYNENGNVSYAVPTMKFKTFLEKYNVKKIDFFKTDCEGGEYDVFNTENLSWIYENVGKIVGEWHLETPEMIANFIKFRDLYLKTFGKVEVHSVDGFNITHKMHEAWFVNYFKQVIVYINNTKK